MNSRGFTLIEILIVVAIVAILAAAAIGNSSGLIDGLRFNNAFNKTVFMVQQARNFSSSGKDNFSHGVQIVNGATSFTIKLFADDDGDGSYDASEESENYSLPSGVSIEVSNLGGSSSECDFPIQILFALRTAEASLKCGTTSTSQIKITLTSATLGRTPSFSITSASGIPQVSQ